MIVEPAVGVYGLRTFRITKDLRLTSLNEANTEWLAGSCLARCRSLFTVDIRQLATTPRLADVPPSHAAPDPKCTCGIYVTTDVAFLRQQYSCAGDIVAVIALQGTVVEGPYGSRAAAGAVVAVWLRPGLLTPAETDQLMTSLPGAVLFDAVDTMIGEYPGLTEDAGLALTPSATSRGCGVANRLRRRWRTPRQRSAAAVFAPFVAAGLFCITPGAVTNVLEPVADSPAGIIVSVLAALLFLAYCATLILRPALRVSLTSPWSVLAGSTVLLTAFMVNTAKSDMLNNTFTAVCTAFLFIWIGGHSLLSTYRPAPAAATAGVRPIVSTARVPTRIDWSTTDPKPVHPARRTRKRSPRG